MVVLPNKRFHCWLHVHIFVLPSNLFPGCEGGISSTKWSVRSAWHTEPVDDGGYIWSLGRVFQLQNGDRITNTIAVGKLGYYLPWSVASGAIVAIGSGLISTFTPQTSTAKWVGYQFLAGIGRGCGMQMASLSSLFLHAADSNSDIPSPSSPFKTSFHQSRSPSGCLLLSFAKYSGDHFSSPLHGRYSALALLMVLRNMPLQSMPKP